MQRTFLTKSIFILLIIVLAVGCKKEQTTFDVSSVLLPAPQEVTYKNGIKIDPAKIKTISLFSAAGEEDRFAAGLLKESLKRLFDISVNVETVKSYKEVSRPSVILGIPSEDQEFDEFSSFLPDPNQDKDQAYLLDIDKKSIVISGKDRSGLFYGVQTLIQLLEEAKWGDGNLQGMQISDWPDMKLRWVHYNYFFHLDRFEYIKESVEKLAKFKINGIVMEFEDRFRYQSHPFVAAPVSLTADQVTELTEYARQYHIDIVPLVQGFGHADYLLKHDQLKHLREDPAIYQSFCPLKEETYEFIFDLFEEVIDATPGVKYFHIGADEVRVMGKCPLCKKKMEEVGDLGLYLTWLNRVHEFMKKHDRTIVYWDDMPLKQAGIYRTTHMETDEKFDSIWAAGTAKLGEIINRFPQDGIFMRWNYGLGRFKGNVSALDWYRDNNFKTMVATAIIGNWPLIPDYDNTPENIQSFLTLGAEKEVLGQLCTAWGDDAGNHFEIYWMGFLASGEYSWSSKSPESLDQYWAKYIRRFFGPNTTDLYPAFYNLSKRVDFWNTAFMKRGMKNRRNYQLKPLPGIENPPEGESWTEYYRSVAESAGTEKEKCVEALGILASNMDKVTNNRHNLEVFESMGELMKKHCDLVLAVGEIAQNCDNALKAEEDGKKEDVVANLEKMATLAENSWKDYKACYEDLREVWEVARYPKGEEGYVMSPQTNYLAGWTADLSYLILAETQLDFPGYAEKIREISGYYKTHGSFPK